MNQRFNRPCDRHLVCEPCGLACPVITELMAFRGVTVAVAKCPGCGTKYTGFQLDAPCTCPDSALEAAGTQGVV